MAIHQGGVGLAEDKVVNTFHFFHATSAYVDHVETAIDAVQSFFQGTGFSENAQFQPIEAYLSPWLSGFWEVRAYDLSTPKIRVPIIRPFTQASFGSGVGLPEEVAAVLSFHGGPPAGRRRRGRTYIGPLNMSGAALPTSSGDRSRPSNNLIADLAKAATRMLEVDPTWCIRSSLPSENFVPIVGGHVDNAFDTQRRRGPDPNARTLWPPPGV